MELETASLSEGIVTPPAQSLVLLRKPFIKKINSLLLKINISQDPVYQRDGDDLTRIVNVDVYTAILGGKVEIDTMKGSVNVPIKPQTQNGSVLRLKGLGMPHYGKEGNGALLLKVQLVLPNHFSEKEIGFIRQAKDSK